MYAQTPLLREGVIGCAVAGVCCFFLLVDADWCRVTYARHSCGGRNPNAELDKHDIGMCFTIADRVAKWGEHTPNPSREGNYGALARLL